MGLASGFTNSFTSGEICDDAWDRVDIQPVAKGCQLAQNLVIKVAGPLAKRRGFWLNGETPDQANLARMVPFRRSVNDALMLVFQNLIAYVYQANGSPLMNGGSQVSFATPYTAAQLSGLRWKQVADVIYFRHSSGTIQPYALKRITDASWSFNAETFPNGPWLTENSNPSLWINVSGGAPVADAASTGAAYMPVGQTVTLTHTGSTGIFDANQVGAYVRLRQSPGQGAGIYAWAAGFTKPAGTLCLSVGNIYVAVGGAQAQNNNVTNPPVHTSGTASDGANNWQFVGDGAGIVQITQFVSPTQVIGTVTAAIPFGDTGTTSWALSAYSNSQGWPRMWPALREERLVSGATANNLDFIDLTESAGFYPASENFHPGQGTGNVLATDAIRRRIGDDGGELLWSYVTNYLVVGSVSGEYLVAGSVLDEPLTPSAVVTKELSAFGSADVYPARCHKGLIYVTRAGACLRELIVDTQQGATTDDLSVLATHIAQRGFAQLAWVLPPDETLFIRLADGGMAAMVYHVEQEVRGFVTMTLPPATARGGQWVCEDIQTLPGPGGFETLWCIWSRPYPAAPSGVQRILVSQSQVADNLFMDIAQAYSGAAVSQLTGLSMFAGETVTVVANGAQQPDVVVSALGTVPVPAGTTSAQVGLRYTAQFIGLKLDMATAGGTIGKRERVVGAIVSTKSTVCQAGLYGGPLETIDTRLLSDIPNITPKRWVQEITIDGDDQMDGRDPRITVVDSTAYDFRLYSIRPLVAVGE